MTLEQRLIALAQAIGADVKALLAAQGSLSALATTAKGSLVAAINELKAAVDAAGGGGAAAGDALLTAALPPAISWEPDSFRLETLAGLYAKFMQGRHGYADRSETDWRLLLKEHRGDGGKTGLIYQAGKAGAYVFYKAVGATLYIRELVWTEEQQGGSPVT